MHRVTNGAVSIGMTVVVEQGRISAVLPDGQYQPAPDLTEIPATGKYVMPGLWDIQAVNGERISPKT